MKISKNMIMLKKMKSLKLLDNMKKEVLKVRTFYSGGLLWKFSGDEEKILVQNLYTGNVN